jgi:hypothetical protein
MKKLSRVFSLFFAALLFFLSISNTNLATASLSDQLSQGTQNTASHFSSPEKTPLYLIRHQGKLVSTTRDLPVYGSKINLTDLYTNRISDEIRSINITSEYISVSQTCDRNLTTRDIVFPFHSFL